VGLLASRCAVSALFFVNGAVVASWVPYIPMVKQRLNIGDGHLGAALLFMAVGALGALPFAGALVSGLGSRAVSVGAALGLCLTLPLPVLASTPLLLALALLIFGAFNSTLDVAMNAQAVEVEQRRGRPIMSSFHALFSVGGLAGAALTGVIAAAGIGAMGHVAATALIGSTLVLIALRALVVAAVHGVREAHARAARPRPAGALRAPGRGRHRRLERGVPDGRAGGEPGRRGRGLRRVLARDGCRSVRR